jgi:hypothetical protein
MISTTSIPATAFQTPDCLATIVIEWENIQLAEADRCSTMLAEIMRQIHALPQTVAGAAGEIELLVAFDDQKITAEEIREFFGRAVAEPASRCTVRFLAGSGHGYYDQKNLGAAQARGRFVVFLDSDVIPEQGWLERLLGSFADPAVDVVCGNCFLDTGDLVSKTLALAWFFPLRDDRQALVPTDWFFANNVAFRREVARANPFVPLEGATRGACRLLGRRMAATGIGLFVNTAARVSHPAPNGLRHLLMRGLAQGRDNLLFDRVLGGGRLRASIKRAWGLQARAWKRIVRERHQVGLSLTAVPAALGLATVYYACYATGDAAARLAPEWTTRHVRLEA